MNNRIKFAIHILKQIEDAVVAEFSDRDGPNGPRIDNVVKLYISASLTTDLEQIEAAIDRSEGHI